jgi:hypothetical protein
VDAERRRVIRLRVGDPAIISTRSRLVNEFPRRIE